MTETADWVYWRGGRRSYIVDGVFFTPGPDHTTRFSVYGFGDCPRCAQRSAREKLALMKQKARISGDVYCDTQNMNTFSDGMSFYMAGGYIRKDIDRYIPFTSKRDHYH